MKEKLEPSPVLALAYPWNKNANLIWLASSLHLYRNIEKFKFPQKLESERRKQIVSLVTKALLGIKELSQPISLKSEELNPIEKDYLAEHFLTVGGFQDAHQGEAFVIDETGGFLAKLNIKDHIELQLVDSEGELEKTWSKLIAIENSLSSSLSLSYSPRFGFLTSDPSLCGTGFVAAAYLHLPALIHLDLLNEKLDADRTESISISGIQGSPDKLIGDIVKLQNTFTLGISEESIISALRNVITRLVVAEKSARNRIKSSELALFQDKVSRALGLLKFSYQMDTAEALSSLSMIKLGIEIGWIKGMTVQKINMLLFACRRAHLMVSFQEKIAPEEISSRRASYMRGIFQNVELQAKLTKETIQETESS